MNNARVALRSRWSNGQRLIATALLSLMPIQALAQSIDAHASQPVRAQKTAASPARAVAPNAATQLALFGPRKYVRTSGAKDVYTTTVTVPSWLKSPFRLFVQNGEADGTFRVSSATIAVNGTEILTQSDFKQTAASYERNVTLTPSSTLVVTLASQPTSYLTLWIYGTVADLTAPRLTWVAPPDGTTVNTATPHLVVRYEDAVGASEPAASGLDLASLAVTIDGTDRSEWFTRRSDEASATVPSDAPLAAGVHAFVASIADVAGNRRQVSGSFRVDLTPPTIQFTSPSAGAYLPSRAQTISLSYADEVALDLASLEVRVNGAPVAVNATASGATFNATLPEGPNQISATIADKGGNTASASLAFNVDVTPPSLVIAQPLAGSRVGSRDVAVTLTYSDDQGIDTSSAAATVDGNAITLTAAASEATGQMTALADSTHALAATIRDRAGNTGHASLSFTVDVTLPVITVTAPPAGANLKTATPDLAVHYTDEQGVVTDSLHVEVNQTDQTPLFTKGADTATATIVTPLPEGPNEIAASIKDLTDNTGSTVSSFTVDTIAPTGSIAQPATRVNSATPLIVVPYADSGSGIDPASVTLAVDGAAVEGVLAAGPDSASGTLPQLEDGEHTVTVTFADRAGNPLTLEATFTVDTKAPDVTIVAPENDSFINTTTPALIVTYADPAGTGADQTSVRLYLRKGGDPEADITSYLTITSGDARGVVPATAPLEDGTYHLRAEVRDLAGNVTTTESAFEVDTVAPSYVIEAPAKDGYVNTDRPQFTIRWSDELSGVDTTRAQVFIDGDDRTSRFTFDADGATGTLASSQALDDGLHAIELVLFDRAGNESAREAQSFTVDTVDPTASITTPADGTFIGAAPHLFAMQYADANGSGVDPASVRITIDGADRTSEFNVTATTATASIATPLADGPHTVALSLLDWAANPATASASFTVDSIAPVVTITAPIADTWVKTATVTVTGTVVDASPVTLEINGIPFVVTGGAFTASIPTTDGTFAIHAVATDPANNSGTADSTINVDTGAPVIHVTSPVDDLVTNAATVHIAGSVEDASAVTLTLDGAPVALTSNAFAIDVPLTTEGAKTFTLAATDAAANTAQQTVTVTHDTIAPAITVAAPAKSSVVGTVPVALSGTIQDATAVTLTVDGVAATIEDAAWHVSIDSLDEGAHAFALVATDAAGNVSTLAHDITIDTLDPVVAISAPVSGALTNLETIAIAGTATDGTLVSVQANGMNATLTGENFAFDAFPLTEGDNTITVIATDALGRTGEASVIVTRDSTAPVVTLDAPELITRTTAATVTATVDENLAVRDVVFQLGEVVVATVTAAPYTASITAPQTAKPGDVLVLTVIATDTAGNATTVTKSLRVTSDGAVIGQVLSDATGLPLANARVRVAGTNTETTTDERGRYALPANEQNLVLVIDADGMTTVERTLAIESGVGTIPVDARLTPLAATKTIGTSGGTITSGNVVVTVPSGLVASSTPMRVTTLSSQGLASLLPLGWSPVAAFDFRVEGASANVASSARVNNVASANFVLAHYSTSLHAWIVADAGASATNLTLAEPGAYALVLADDTNVPAAVAGDVLRGVAMQPIADNATSTGSVNPPTLPPSGGTATGTLAVQSPAPLPSGTVVQAEVTETFSLTSGEVASEETRTQDIVLYRDGGNDVHASFPIAPSRTFTTADLAEGKVHLDILAGRESVRGKTGGSQALTLTSGDLALTIPAGSLPQDLAISATPSILSTFLPSNASAVPFAEVVLDFGGVSLASPATLSVSATNVPAGERVLIAKVIRVRGIPRVVVVAAAELSGDRFVTASTNGLPGITTDGRYVFYRLNVAWGLVSGTTGANALVTSSGLPFAAVASASGAYTLVTRTGTQTISATVPGTSLGGQTTVSVTSGSTSSANVPLTAATTTATVTPADGALHVPTSVQVEIAATAPLDPQTANSGTVRLLDANNALVPVRYVVSGSGRILALVPQAALDAGATYHLSVSGLKDIYGGSVEVPSISFSTMTDEPPQYDTSRITFSMPDDDNLVTVSAPAGSLPPGTRILVVASGSGAVASFTAGNDGSFTGKIPATINDRLLVTVTDPQGNVVTFERSEFVFSDGSGRVAIGPGGGTVTGPGGVELRIPDGALESGAVFKVEAFGPEAFPERPSIEGAHFGSGLRIISEQKPKLKKEGDLVFPRPADAPAGSFFYIYRRMTGPNGKVALETVDHAFDDGHGKVVTASYPFIGWGDSAVAWDAAANAGGVGFGLGSQVVMFMMWTWDAMLPGLPIPGAIIGKAYRAVWKGGTEPEYEPVQDAMIQAVPQGEILEIARSGPDGTFALFDPKYRGGAVDVRAIGPLAGDDITATAFQANPANTRSNAFAAVEKLYGYAAEINFTFPAASQPAVSAGRTRVFKLDANSKRVDAGGIVIAGTPLVIGFKFDDPNTMPYLQNASILGQELPVKTDATNDPLKVDYVLNDPYTPQQPGTYTVTATAIPPMGGSPVTLTHTFLVVAQGGNNSHTINGTPPDVVTDLVDPRPDSIGNATNVFPTVTFTEPVKHIGGNVSLSDDEGDVAVTISGIGVDAQGNQSVIPDVLAQNAETAVTSITIQPRGELKFGKQYTLRLDGGIVDLDKNAQGADDPHALQNTPRLYHFTTLEPQVLGASAESFSSTAVIALGDRAYSIEAASPHGKLRVFDIGTDPSTPTQMSETYLSGMPSHIAGENESTLTGGRVIALNATNMLFRGPSNVWIYDASTDTPQRLGVVSTTESTEQGISLRLAMKGRYVYSWTWPRGIQIIDMQRAQEVFARWNADPNMRTEMYRDLVTEGRGFGSEAIVNTIAVPGPTGGSAHLFGLKVDDYMLDGVSQPVIIATGSIPLVVANPQTTQSWRFPSLTGPNNASLSWGWALALGHAADKPIAVIAGRGTSQTGGEWVLAVVDLTNPKSPKLLSCYGLPVQPTDLVMKDTLALIAAGDKVIGVSVTDPDRPVHAGDIPNIGGRLALNSEGLLISTAGAGSSGGIRTAALGSFALIRAITPKSPDVDANGVTLGDIKITYTVVNPSPDLKTLNVRLLTSTGFTATIPVPVPENTQPVTITIPHGQKLALSAQTVSVRLRRPNGSKTLPYKAAVLQLKNGGLTTGSCGTTTTSPSSQSTPSSRSVASSAVAPPLTNEGSSLLLMPNVVGAGTQKPVVRVSASYANGAPTMHVRTLGGAWQLFPLDTNDTWPGFELPSALAANPAFLQISRSDQAEEALVFLVADPALPGIETAPEIGLYEYRLEEPDDASDPKILTLLGAGFADGMKVVIGRGNTPAFTLPTSFVNASTLTADLPREELGLADDLWVAVLTADGQKLSHVLLLDRKGVFGGVIDEEEVDDHPDDYSIADAYTKDDVEITDVQLTGPDVMEVRGVGLTAGMTVEFTTVSPDGVETTTEAPLGTPEYVNPDVTVASTSRVTSNAASDEEPPREQRAQVVVPLRDNAVNTVSINGQNAQGRQVVSSPRVPFRPNDRYEMGLGGREKFGVYKMDDDYYILSPCERERSSDRERLILQNMGASIQINSSSPSGKIQLERESADQLQFVYVRALGFTSATSMPRLKLSSDDKVGRSISVVSRSLRGPHYVIKLNTGDVDLDDLINKVADRRHVPPQILKAQIEHESEFIKNFRYEAGSLDLRIYSSDNQGTRTCTQRNPQTRLCTASVPMVLSNVYKDYVVGGTVLNPSQSAVTQSFAAPTRIENGLSVYQLDHKPKRRLEVSAKTIKEWWSAGNVGEGNPAVWVDFVAANGRRTPLCKKDYTAASRYNKDGLHPCGIVFFENIWRRVYAKNAQAGVVTPPGQLTTDSNYGVNYHDGLVYVRRALQPGERIEIRYYPADTADAVLQVNNDGSRVQEYDVAAMLKDRHVVKPTPSRRKFIFKDTIAQYFVRNMNNGGGTYADGSAIVTIDQDTGEIGADHLGDVLAATDTDRELEFRVGSGKPTAPRDPKINRMTAQYFASSSYGPLQVTLQLWIGETKRAQTFRQVFPLTSRNLIELLWDYEKGIELGAALDEEYWQTNYNSSTQYTEATWGTLWRKILTLYNAGDANNTDGQAYGAAIHTASSRFGPM